MHIFEGIVPTKQFVRRRRVFTFTKLLIDDGIGPVNLLAYNWRITILVNFPISEGINPIMLLAPRFICVSEFNDAIPVGMVPVSLLVNSENEFNAVNLLMSKGIVPKREFFAMLRNVKLVTVPKLEGIEPDIAISSKFNDTTLEFKHLTPVHDVAQ